MEAARFEYLEAVPARRVRAAVPGSAGEALRTEIFQVVGGPGLLPGNIVEVVIARQHAERQHEGPTWRAERRHGRLRPAPLLEAPAVVHEVAQVGGELDIPGARG